MTVARATVVDGRIVVDGLPLPDGTVVTIRWDEDAPAVRLTAAEEDELAEAVDEADAEEGGAGPEFLDGLRRYG